MQNAENKDKKEDKKIQAGNAKGLLSQITSQLKKHQDKRTKGNISEKVIEQKQRGK